MTAFLIKALSAVAICACFAVALNTQKPEYSFLLSIACGVAVILAVLDTVLPSVTRIKVLFEKADGATSYFSFALKALGIGYLTGFIADTCRDFGQSSLALKAELAGKCAIFILCVPLVSSILEAALKFAGI